MKKGGEDKMKKKQWLKPVLTILVRRQNAESILTACRGSGSSGATASMQGFCSNTLGNPCPVCG